MPCPTRLLPTPKKDAAFHDFAAFERLVTAVEAAGVELDQPSSSKRLMACDLSV